jgi:metal-responsive CopG/Arc/MetJ family transcriptional regulator
MGRPPTGVDPMFSVRLPPDLIERINEYAKQSDQSRSHAMRELLEAGLVHKAAMGGGKSKSPPKRVKGK